MAYTEFIYFSRHLFSVPIKFINQQIFYRIMEKKIIFFEGDGTLWYPKKTKYSKHPVWLYWDKRFKKHVNHLKMVPSALPTIKRLKEMGIIT